MPANSNFGQMETSTLVNWLNKKFADTVYDGLPLFAWLKGNGRKKMQDGGRKFIEPLMTSGNTTVGWLSSGYDELDLTPQAGFSAAEFPIAAISVQVVMSELEQAQNRGKSEVIDLWQSKIEQARMSIQDQLNQDAYKDGTQATGAIVGLDAMVNTTGTYGNIARSGNTFWQSYKDTTVEALDDDDMLTALNTASRNRGKLSDYLIITTRALWEKYHQLLVPNTRYEDTKMANLGFPNVTFMGAPVVWDEDCQSGRMYFLHKDNIRLQCLQGYDFSWTPKRQPTRQLVDAVICRAYIQLTTGNCRFHGRLEGRS